MIVFISARTLVLGILFFVILFAIIGCSNPAPSCRVGPLAAMNAGQWTPTPAELQQQ